jgi:hypothetical protein
MGVVVARLSCEWGVYGRVLPSSYEERGVGHWSLCGGTEVWWRTCFFLFLMVKKGGKKDTGHVDRYISERSCSDSSQRLKCGTKEGLCVVEELKVRGSLLQGHPSCLAGLFPLVRVVEASKYSVG